MTETFSVQLEQVLVMRPSNDQGMFDPEPERISLQLTNAASDKRHLGGLGERILQSWNPETIAYEINGHTKTRVLSVKSLHMVLYVRKLL